MKRNLAQKIFKATFHEARKTEIGVLNDFSKLGPILEGSVEDRITDFRSLSYSLSDEEAAKQKAVSAAMHHAIGRANASLEAKGQKVGALRFSNLDVRQLRRAFRDERVLHE